MRTSNDIRKCVVCLNNGSGVVYQPGNKLTYIFTADHVFYKRDGEEKVFLPYVSIQYFDEVEKRYKEVEPKVELRKGENYFPLRDADVAILVIDQLQNIENWIKPTRKVDEDSDSILGGIPGLRRNQFPDDHTKWYVDHRLSDIDLGGVRRSGRMLDAVNKKNITLDELRGMSGGGIFQISGEKISLLGIQNQGPLDNEHQGRFLFTPIVVFEELFDGIKEKMVSIFNDETTTVSSDEDTTDSSRTGKRKKKFLFSFKIIISLVGLLAIILVIQYKNGVVNEATSMDPPPIVLKEKDSAETPIEVTTGKPAVLSKIKYEVTLVVPSTMVKEEVYIDNKKAEVVNRGLNTITVRVRQKNSSHHFEIKKGALDCIADKLIDKDAMRFAMLCD
ncbi:MAG: hypothetical protein KJN76_04920 [Eudoraea sp.]|nr:hypothetical protein [Eudoraea sp.]